MQAISVTAARRGIFHLLEEVNLNHHPILISSKKKGAVLIAEDDWRSIQETLHLLAIPGMRESIVEGLKLPFDQCSDTVEW